MHLTVQPASQVGSCYGEGAKGDEDSRTLVLLGLFDEFQFGFFDELQHRALGEEECHVILDLAVCVLGPGRDDPVRDFLCRIAGVGPKQALDACEAERLFVPVDTLNQAVRKAGDDVILV